jgi:hypothetical protein
MNKPHRPGPDAWRQIIDGQRPSGLTVAAYCLERGITQGSFYTWKTEVARTSEANPFAQARVCRGDASEGGAHGTIEICLPGERRLLARRGFDRELLIELIRALESIA